MRRRVVAEIGSCDGDPGYAADVALAAVEAGAWAVKGQMFTADTLVTRDAATYGKASIQEPATQWEAFQKTLTYDQWARVGELVEAKGGVFFASVFNLEALDAYPWRWVKIASADITYQALIEKAAATRAEMILSTGASDLDDISRALSWVNGTMPTLLACTLSYPTLPQDANVNRVITLADVYGGRVGYSDHTRGTAAARYAFELGASIVEKHFTIRPGMGGDHDFAITPDDMPIILDHTRLVSEAIRAVYGGDGAMYVHPAEYDARIRARRSLHAAVNIPAGITITSDMLAVLRPADGIAPYHVGQVVGRRASRNIRAGEPITSNLVGW